MTGLGFFIPADPVVFAQFALRQLGREDADGRLFENTGFFAFAATRAEFGMHRRQEHGVAAGARVGHDFERDRLVDDRADPIAHITAQAEEVETGFVVDEHGNAHLRLVDVGQTVVKRAGRAGLDAGDVFAHLTRYVARGEKWCAGRYRGFRFGQFERAVGAVAHAHAATDAGTKEIIFRQRAGRTQGQRRQRLRLLGVEPKAEAKHANTTNHPGGIKHELATRGAILGGICFHYFHEP